MRDVVVIVGEDGRVAMHERHADVQLLGGPPWVDGPTSPTPEERRAAQDRLLEAHLRLGAARQPIDAQLDEFMDALRAEAEPSMPRQNRAARRSDGRCGPRWRSPGRRW